MKEPGCPVYCDNGIGPTPIGCGEYPRRRPRQKERLAEDPNGSHDETYDAPVNAPDAAAVTSGTATLEAGYNRHANGDRL